MIIPLIGYILVGYRKKWGLGVLSVCIDVYTIPFCHGFLQGETCNKNKASNTDKIIAFQQAPAPIDFCILLYASMVLHTSDWQWSRKLPCISCLHRTQTAERLGFPKIGKALFEGS